MLIVASYCWNTSSFAVCSWC